MSKAILQKNKAEGPTLAHVTTSYKATVIEMVV